MAPHEDRIYHGVQHSPDHDGSVIEVTLPSEGWHLPSPRVLYRLAEPKGLNFTWGYDGRGTSVSAAAVLADVLGLTVEEVDFGGDPQWDGLREAFCHDVLAQQLDEWRLRHRAVVRWADGWYAQSGIKEVPQILREGPPPPQY